jgi:hypothetical protein
MSESSEQLRDAARALAGEVARASRKHLPVIGRAARQVVEEEGPRIAGAVRRAIDDLRRKRV